MSSSPSPNLTMDPTTTLFTFMVRTAPTVNSVQLLGSWDNFSNCYKMERDSRRDRGQWRGCHTFQDTNPGNKQQQQQHHHHHHHQQHQQSAGGLRMGETYYYYYEVDGSVEIHDPAMPNTNVCPYLPGQTVNTLDVPIEHSSRVRRASMNSMRDIDFKTLDPQDKFITPRPVPPIPDSFGPRPGTAHAMPQLHHKSSSRSLSPSPAWAHAARRFFGGLRPSSRSSDHGGLGKSSDSDEAAHLTIPDPAVASGGRGATPSDGSRSRDLSPEALQRFLSDDPPTTGHPVMGPPQPLEIPEDIVEEIDDDDNFATSATSETGPFTTLSPPPFQRSSSTSSSADDKLDSIITSVPERTVPKRALAATSGRRGPPPGMRVAIPRSHFSMSTTSSAVVSPTSPESNNSFEDGGFSFFDDSNDEDSPSPAEGTMKLRPSQQRPMAAYSLPRSTANFSKPVTMAPSSRAQASPALITRTENGMPVGNAALLGMTGIDSGLDELVHEIGWLAHAI